MILLTVVASKYPILINKKLKKMQSICHYDSSAHDFVYEEFGTIEFYNH